MTPQEKAEIFVKKYPLMFNSDQDFWTEKIAELIAPEMSVEDVEQLAVENEKKNQRIRELEEALRELLEVGENDYANSEETIASMYEWPFSRAKQLLNQKP